jgi:hypothetical protein
MTFGKRACSTFADFLCGASMSATFFKEQMLANCSAECPAVCSSIDFNTKLTFAKYPPASLLYYTLANSETLAQKHFNLSASAFQYAMENVRPDLVPSMSTMETTLSGKLVALKINYEDLMYTKIEESAKLTVVDLIAGMGGTLVI